MGSPNHPALTRPPPASPRGIWLAVVSAWLWIPQAALLAALVAGIADGAAATAALPPALGALALGLLRAWLDLLSARLVFAAARHELSRLRRDALYALACRSPLDPARPPSGAAAAAIAEQAEALLPYLARFRPARLRAAAVPPAILLAVLSQSWLAALILLIAAPLIPLFMALIGLRAKEASEAQMLEIGGMNALLLDRLRGLATIRAFDAVDATAARLRAAAETVRRRSMTVLRIAFLSSAVLELFASLGVAMVAVYVGFHLLGVLRFGAWEERMGLGPALFVLLVAPAFFEPLRELASAWHDKAAGEAALASLRALAAPPALAMPGALAAPSLRRAPAPLAVSVRRLVFRYPGATHPVFDALDLTVAAGERVALLAPSGGGKSTLLALLAGLALPDSGEIRVGGILLDGATAADIRARTAWVGQRPILFAATLQANILLGRRDLAAQAEDWRQRLLPAITPSRAIGEDGAGLSGGEALRVGLARALVSPCVGLILADEPTAHLDRDTAASATRALLAAAEGRTLILATHDGELAARMDRVVRLV